MKNRARSSEAGGSDERTKDRILDAAERLFAESGYDGTSVRDINAVANVNSGAIHYYFRTKHELFREVVTRRGRILSDDRRARLDQCEEADGRPPLLEQIIAAYIVPYFNPALGSRQQRLQFARLRARMIADDSREADAMPLGRTHEDTGRRFVEALTRALPTLGLEEVRLRYLVMWSALNTLSAGLGFSALSGRAGAVPKDPIGQFAAMTPQLINLLSAMFRAPQVDAAPIAAKAKKAKAEPGRKPAGSTRARASKG